jgi:hypothetical protein
MGRVALMVRDARRAALCADPLTRNDGDRRAARTLASQKILFSVELPPVERGVTQVIVPGKVAGIA